MADKGSTPGIKGRDEKQVNDNVLMSPQPPRSRRVMGPSLTDTNDTEIMSPQPPPSRRVMGPSLNDTSDIMSPQPPPNESNGTFFNRSCRWK
ncbi:hypothetical protein CYY_002248 [Polysphondylium violaceum]|uniref:Uncharacterized protein n=1 Tax=Polysphondylium violaceum TaxID=133409 RepID=A0A8J4PZQ0_9MYCE|nr:hypothetical protein CYY_002248 [Polysphondylium violaceum]